MTCEHLEEDDAARPDVGRFSRVRGVGLLLGGGVLASTEPLCDARDAIGTGELVERSTNREVDEVEMLAMLKHVCGLNVAMDDAGLAAGLRCAALYLLPPGATLRTMSKGCLATWYDREVLERISTSASGASTPCGARRGVERLSGDQAVRWTDAGTIPCWRLPEGEQTNDNGGWQRQAEW
jgi:hypothetical protein